MPFVVSPEERAALEAACEAFLPLPDPASATPAAVPKDFDVAGQILEMMADQNLAEQAEFRQLLGLLNSKIAGLLFGGSWAAFRAMPVERRVRILQKWMGSRLNLLRKAFAMLKKLTLFLHYGSHKDHQHPAWASIDYFGALGSASGPKSSIRPLEITQDTVLKCDVVIVGSEPAADWRLVCWRKLGWM